VAQALRERGWRVYWLGGTGSAAQPSMESRLVPPQGFAFEALDFSGVRGKGLVTLVRLPGAAAGLLAKHSGAAPRQARRGGRHGGYITFPAGLHECPAGQTPGPARTEFVAGLANRLLARVAARVFTAFPDVLKKGRWVGNPLRPALSAARTSHALCRAQRPLAAAGWWRGLGARVLNDIVPQALALIPLKERPLVIHQSGATQIDALRANYAAAGVLAQLTPSSTTRRSLCRRRPGDLPRRCEHRDRAGGGGRGGDFCALAFGRG